MSEYPEPPKLKNLLHFDGYVFLEVRAKNFGEKMRI
jgi:hypothetical protein